MMSTLLIAALMATSPAPFAGPHLSDAELRTQTGGFVTPRAVQQRDMSDSESLMVMQLQSQTSRLTFDNWFANEGTILIVNNQLAALGR